MKLTLAVFLSSFHREAREHGWSDAAKACAGGIPRFPQQVKACSVLRHMCSRLRAKERSLSLWCSGIRSALGLVHSLPELRQVCEVLEDMATELPPNGMRYALLDSLELAHSVPELRGVVAILQRIAGELTPEALRAISEASVRAAVQEAIRLRAIHGDFGVAFTFTPGETHTHTTEEVVEYGGTGTNAYSREVHTTTHEEKDPDLVVLVISPPKAQET